jgi:hydroxymethylpyrimidine/phosphomethylpyrimidine kinase
VVDLTRERLLPLATVITPNTPEAARLSRHDDPRRWGETLRELGARNVLITGGHALTEAEARMKPLPPIVNTLHREDGHVRGFEMPACPSVITAPVAPWPLRSRPFSPAAGIWSRRSSRPRAS